ncbi:tRNA dihydrouridine synthase DusB [candidate division WOR-1 bacterium RIFOXYA2_FULL_36_21]|uniref:tRNA-dihydrouridine synthase n=1 Tax=candidate division WOR-1 bacterium RIFOXYB2_FULL_36_35 TaxID=1802578 RepID=A0A1F4S5W9_UNCSA|nr:MAG: tRNA dihydrouridine synthase DusB [candidate division WOR-1 bacterium RIFOXYA2_FULL_36_21]OGC15835.1 MAG: tRNA dihydrouridine synthase DusB [candidate division WOR-1 bacterium RIFOXYB2_FULL_36_35]OGC15903.1 MAG: tRNA dihydrouridine synthase DusB [candidate division WOR-1 bacterium RIFOXYA12_FULL_36_13]
MITIGSTKIKTNIFLAPLAGCSDLAFRLLSREYGAKFCFFEMVDAHSLIYGTKQSFDILKTHPKDKPIAAQLLGSDPEIMLRAALKLLEFVKIDFLDINAGCPVNKVIKKNCGSYLVKEPENLFKVIKKLSQNLSVPVTVKLRSGFLEKDTKKLILIAKRCEDSGAAALFIHGRTRSQLYSGEIDYEAIEAVKKNVAIPVFGSGNIFNCELAKKMFEETGCDGILVARGAFGNPWIFKNLENYLKTGKEPREITLSAKKKALKRHLYYINKYRKGYKPRLFTVEPEIHPDFLIGVYNRGENSVVGSMRKVALWYTKSFEGAAKLRGQINNVQSHDELIDLIDEFMN